MSDKELLELAAKAAGREFNPEWDPLNDNSDALMLAVKCGITVSQASVDSMGCVYAQPPHLKSIFEDIGDDPYQATRRAIVRAAAEIGRKG